MVVKTRPRITLTGCLLSIFTDIQAVIPCDLSGPHSCYSVQSAEERCAGDCLEMGRRGTSIGLLCPDQNMEQCSFRRGRRCRVLLMQFLSCPCSLFLLYLPSLPSPYVSICFSSPLFAPCLPVCLHSSLLHHHTEASLASQPDGKRHMVHTGKQANIHVIGAYIVEQERKNLKHTHTRSTHTRSTFLHTVCY